MSWDAVRAWRELLREADAASLDTGLSPEGAREALRASLDALSDQALAQVAALPLRPFPRAAVIAAATVSTAPIEWCAVLLGRGTEVVLKASRRNQGLAPLLESTARASGLPLSVSFAREAADGAPLVVAMASDQTLAQLRQQLAPSVRFLPHGHRFSVAWVTGAALPPDPLIPAEFQDPWGRVAADAALHDGRGCLSPVVVFTPLPLSEAADALGEAMARAEARWPRGRIEPAEAARARALRAHARVGGALREGPGWAVHGLPLAAWSPAALPRGVALVQVAGLEQALAALGPWAGALSTVSTDDPRSAPRWVDAGATRVCATGRSQRPPLVRPHDGEDWLRATGLSVSWEL
ncbi:MAG: hypothetical protein JXX28_06005 [Deltaproteobacteria bacterium]|nr:hypothetical protein [Deltaproteobacteria bacterium]